MYYVYRGTRINVRGTTETGPASWLILYSVSTQFRSPQEYRRFSPGHNTGMVELPQFRHDRLLRYYSPNRHGTLMLYNLGAGDSVVHQGADRVEVFRTCRFIVLP
jgi:hypothetical protein